MATVCSRRRRSDQPPLLGAVPPVGTARRAARRQHMGRRQPSLRQPRDVFDPARAVAQHARRVLRVARRDNERRRTSRRMRGRARAPPRVARPDGRSRRQRARRGWRAGDLAARGRGAARQRETTASARRRPAAQGRIGRPTDRGGRLVQLLAAFHACGRFAVEDAEPAHAPVRRDAGAGPATSA